MKQRRKKMIKIMGLLTLGAVIMTTGCVTTGKNTARENTSGASGIFTESSGRCATGGRPVLTITASVKKHRPGVFLMDDHAKSGFRMILDMDGQSVSWNMEGREEKTPVYDEGGRKRSDPEAGDGVRYNIEKKIQVTPGLHKVKISLPDEPREYGFELMIKGGADNILEIKPVYFFYHRYRQASFMAEVKSLEARFNGRLIK
jgi:hypothetical protein